MKIKASRSAVGPSATTHRWTGNLTIQYMPHLLMPVIDHNVKVFWHLIDWWKFVNKIMPKDRLYLNNTSSVWCSCRPGCSSVLLWHDTLCFSRHTLQYSNCSHVPSDSQQDQPVRHQAKSFSHNNGLKYYSQHGLQWNMDPIPLWACVEAANSRNVCRVEEKF